LNGKVSILENSSEMIFYGFYSGFEETSMMGGERGIKVEGDSSLAGKSINVVSEVTALEEGHYTFQFIFCSNEVCASVRIEGLGTATSGNKTLKGCQVGWSGEVTDEFKMYGLHGHTHKDTEVGFGQFGLPAWNDAKDERSSKIHRRVSKGA
jgi:hypothetical protein